MSIDAFEILATYDALAVFRILHCGIISIPRVWHLTKKVGNVFAQLQKRRKAGTLTGYSDELGISYVPTTTDNCGAAGYGD